MEKRHLAGNWGSPLELSGKWKLHKKSTEPKRFSAEQHVLTLPRYRNHCGTVWPSHLLAAPLLGLWPGQKQQFNSGICKGTSSEEPKCSLTIESTKMWQIHIWTVEQPQKEHSYTYVLWYDLPSMTWAKEVRLGVYAVRVSLCEI